ncbi:MAG: hypothetical protein WCW31_03540 [Patescibacteria group bacterium]|jgi:hypothetical protein
MILAKDYADRGITEVAVLKHEYFPRHHNHDTDKTYVTIVGKQNNEYIVANAVCYESRSGDKAFSLSGQKTITREEYDKLVEEAKKAPPPPPMRAFRPRRRRRLDF